MKTVFYRGLLALALGMVVAAPTAFAETFSGKINGHNCAHAGTSCPVDRLDPHVALEPDFVLQKSDGDYMFLSNVPRSVKVRHALSSAEVKGTLNQKYQSIDVDELRIGGKVVWSKAMQQAEFENLYSEGQNPGLF